MVAAARRAAGPPCSDGYDRLQILLGDALLHVRGRPEDRPSKNAAVIGYNDIEKLIT
jgi:hypothetical protein